MKITMDDICAAYKLMGRGPEEAAPDAVWMPRDRFAQLCRACYRMENRLRALEHELEETKSSWLNMRRTYNERQNHN